MQKPRVVILGAGPAGLGAAFQLARRNLAQVTVLERNSFVGGNAGSFELAGMNVDYGSHRLHPASDPEILRDIGALLGDDLLDRPRHGRIKLRGRWIHFPLKPVDLAVRLPPGFAMGVASDMIGKRLRRTQVPMEQESFASVLQSGLGQTICRDFYFPYARKIWGAEPEELSAIQARRRVSAGSLGKMGRRVLSMLPGFRSAGRGRFFYPRNGFGQISEAYSRAAQDAGARLELNAQIQAVEMNGASTHRVRFEKAGQQLALDADHVWSTIPITTLVRCLKPEPPSETLQATERISYRAMILIYLVLEQERFTEYDAHYFPESEIPITRLTEPKNYRDQGPRGVTVLCAELPCDPADPEWKKSDQELGELVRDALDRAGIPVRAPIRQVVTRRLRQAYPIYHPGYETHFEKLDHHVSQIEGLLTFGRQGLFAHDNTHHALFMAYSAAACLDENGCFDRDRWLTFRLQFEKHVVED